MPIQSLWVVGLLVFLGGSPRASFYCHSGYSREACDAQVAQLRTSLAKFDVGPLGNWTWVLVRSEDWGPILRRVKRDPDSPAFTILEKRQTFLEEALFRPVAGRSRTLLEKWRVPLDRLLDYAVSHELGHAICRERDEARVYESARQLNRFGRAGCTETPAR